MSICKKIGFGLVVVISAFVVNCSSDPDESSNDVCDTGKSKCANDPTPSADDRATCKRLLADSKCGSVNAAALLCGSQKQVCGMDGKTDETKTADACRSQINAADACSPDGGTRN